MTLASPRVLVSSITRSAASLPTIGLSACTEARKLLSGGVKNVIKHWDLKTGEVKCEYEGHDSWVMCITLFPDKKHFLCGSCDRTIRHWEVGKEECLRYMIKHTQGIYGIEIIDDNTFISASADWSLKLWNFEDGTVIRTYGNESWEPEEHAGCCCVTSPPPPTQRLVSNQRSSRSRR